MCIYYMYTYTYYIYVYRYMYTYCIYKYSNIIYMYSNIIYIHIIYMYVDIYICTITQEILKRDLELRRQRRPRLLRQARLLKCQSAIHFTIYKMTLNLTLRNSIYVCIWRARLQLLRKVKIPNKTCY